MLRRIYDKIVRIYYTKILNNPVKYARKLGVKVGNDTIIIGDPAVMFDTERYLVTIGDHCLLTGCKFLMHDGSVRVLAGLEDFFKNYDYISPIQVGNNVFIGYGAIILPGTNIGDNVIIGAGAVVTGRVRSGTIVGGVPAKEISTIEKYMDKVRKEGVPTLGMSPDKKKKALMKLKPEWF